MADSDQRPDLRFYEDSFRLPFDKLVTQLLDILGVRLVAYIGGVKTSSAVSAWAAGEVTPDETVQERLRHAYHAAALLREHYGAVTTQTWFKGQNPELADEAPARVLRDGDAHRVLVAARSFAYVG